MSTSDPVGDVCRQHRDKDRTLANGRAFRITGHVWTEVPVPVATITRDGHVGRGGACGVYYRGEAGQRMLSETRELAAMAPAKSET